MMPVMSAPFRAELKELARIAWPVALTYVCRYGMLLTDTSVMGHLGTKYLAASSLSGVWMTVTLSLFAQSLGDATRMLCAQALGASKPKLAGEWLQLCLVAMLCTCVPVAAAWVFTGDVLHAAGTAAETAGLASRFARISIGWLAPFVVYVGCNQFLAAQKIVLPALVSNVLCLALNAGLNLVLVYGMPGVSWLGGLGFDGSPLATVCSRIFLISVYYVYVVHVRKLHAPAWGGWSRHAFRPQRVRELLRQAVPLAAAAAFEEWQLQCLTFMAGRMGDAPVAAHTAMAQIFDLVCSFMYGIGTAASVRISFHVGNADIPAAKTALRATVAMSVVTAVVVAGALAGLCNQVGHLFSSDPAVLALSAQLAPLVAGSYAFLSLCYTALAALDAQGRPTVMAVAFFVGLWCVSMPLAYVLGVVLDYGVKGMWWAMVVGYLLITVLAGVAVMRSDWEDIVLRASKRQEKDSFSDSLLDDTSVSSSNPVSGTMDEELGLLEEDCVESSRNPSP